jgi:hypothetical protein
MLFLVANPRAEAAKGSLSFHDQSGNATAVSFANETTSSLTLNLSPNTTVSCVTVDGSGPLRVGYAQLDVGSEAVSGVAVLRF